MESRSKIWVCGACGRSGKTRMTVGDESCYLNSVEVWEDTAKRGANGLVRAATAVPSEKRSAEIEGAS